MREGIGLRLSKTTESQERGVNKSDRNHPGKMFGLRYQRKRQRYLSEFLTHGTVLG
jgi:hypothetical protein